jgi:signal transduction histidine kinase
VVRNNNIRIALQISLLYALIASFWFFIFDYLLEKAGSEQQQLARLVIYKLVIYKEVSFVAVTILLLFISLLRVLHTQSHADANRRLTEIRSIRLLTAALLQQQTLDDVLPLICSEAQQLTGAQEARLLLVENESWVQVFSQTGNAAPKMERLPRPDPLSEPVLLPKKPMLFNDPASLPQVSQEYPVLKSLVMIPFLIDNTVIGTLHVGNKPGGFTQDDMRILSLFADQAAIAIANSQLHGHAKQLAVLQERQRLARELHDSVTQVLYSVNLYADATRLALSVDKKAEAIENLQELRKLARQAMADMRLLLFQLHPPVLKEEGLVAALQARLDAIESRAGLQVALHVDGENSLPSQIEEELYKITHEALNNVVKHAKAEHVTIDILFTDTHSCITIQDDGVGFDPVEAQGEGGLGLRSIAERVQQIGGHLLVESAPEQGTKLQVKVNPQPKETVAQSL